jgi:general secretion pathway protein K
MMARMNRTSLGNQRGVALVTVLFVVALTVIVAVEMSGRLQLQVQRTTNLTGNRQAYWYAVGAEQLVKQQLKRINEDDKGGGGKSGGNVIHSGQDWAMTGLEFPVDGGKIAGELKDLQACFNLNSLAADATAAGSGGNNNNANNTNPPNQGGLTPSGDKPDANNNTNNNNANSPARRQGIPFAMEAFQRLLEDLEIDSISDAPPEYLAQRLKDWVDADSRQTGGGGMEEGDYMGLEIPYLAANTLMTSVSELRLVGGFTPAVYNKIKDYICVIPGDQILKININTLDPEKPELLTAMLKGLSKSDAQSLISGSQPEGYAQVSDFWDKSEMSQVDSRVKEEAIQYFDVTTSYFALKAETNFGDSKFYLNSKLHINASKQVTVIARKFGVDL